MLVHGQVSPLPASNLAERIQRARQDFAQQHVGDPKLGRDQKRSDTRLAGTRTWLFAQFRQSKREAG